MVVLSMNNGLLLAEVPPLEAGKMKQVPGARYNSVRETWAMPVTLAQVHALAGLFPGRVKRGDDVDDALDALYTWAETVTAAKQGHYDNSITDQHLFGFQRTGVAFLHAAGSALLGDDMGVGKTIQALVALPEEESSLIICTNSMKHKWAAEARIWRPDLEPFVIEGNASKRRQVIQRASAVKERPVLLIINYEALRLHTRLAGFGSVSVASGDAVAKELNQWDWGAVVADEAHKIKEPTTKQTRAVWQMGRQARNRIALTGTPLVNNPDDLWAIMHFVAPDEWPSRTLFRERYCLTQVGWHGGIENLGLNPTREQEFRQFFEPRFLRRTKAEVLPDLPLKMPLDIRLLPLTARQEKLYNKLAKDFYAHIEEQLLAAPNPLTLSIRLRQAACAMLNVSSDGQVTHLSTPSNKLEAIKDLLDESTEQIVIFSDSRKFAELVVRELTAVGIQTALLSGQVSPANRQLAIDRFQAGDARVFVGTLGAGAEGITLTAASTVVLAQQGWSHVQNAQAIDRVHRIGQTSTVHPIVLVSQHTIEEAVLQVDQAKEERLQEIVRDPEWWRRALHGQ